MWQNSPRPRETMSAKAASFLANRGAPAISRRIERVSAQAAATGDAGEGKRSVAAGLLVLGLFLGGLGWALVQIVRALV